MRKNWALLMNILYSYKGALDKKLTNEELVSKEEVDSLDSTIDRLFQDYNNIADLSKDELDYYLGMISDVDKKMVSNERIKELAVLSKSAKESPKGYLYYTDKQCKDMQNFIWSLVRRKKLMERQLKASVKDREFIETEIKNCDILLSKFNKLDGNHIIEESSYLTTIINSFDNIDLPPVKRVLFLKDIIRAEKDIFESKTNDGANLNYDKYDVSLTYESAKSILSRYDIKFSEIPGKYQEYLIDNGTESNMMELLDIIKKSPISNYYSFLNKRVDVFVYILCNSSVDALNKMADIAQKYNLDLSKYPKNVFGVEDDTKKRRKRCVKKDNSLPKRRIDVDSREEVDVEKPLSDTFFKNVELLTSMGIPVENASEQTICLMPHETLKRNISISKLYGIGFIKPSKGNYVLTGMLNNEMDINLDRFIELGLYDYAIENKSSLTTYNEMAFRRLKYAMEQYGANSVVKKSNTIRITSEVRRENGFNINDDNVDIVCPVCNVNGFDERFSRISNYSNCTYNPDILHHPYIASLEEHKSDDGIAYNIGGVLVSRFKVLRTFNTIVNHPGLGINDTEGFIYSVKCNSLFDSNQMNIIDSHIESMFEKGDINGISKGL